MGQSGVRTRVEVLMTGKMKNDLVKEWTGARWECRCRIKSCGAAGKCESKKNPDRWIGISRAHVQGRAAQTQCGPSPGFAPERGSVRAEPRVHPRARIKTSRLRIFGNARKLCPTAGRKRQCSIANSLRSRTRRRELWRQDIYQASLQRHLWNS